MAQNFVSAGFWCPQFAHPATSKSLERKEGSYQLDLASQTPEWVALRTLINELRAVDRATSALIRIGVQSVLTTSSNTVGARSMRPAPSAHHASSSSRTSS